MTPMRKELPGRSLVRLGAPRRVANGDAVQLDAVPAAAHAMLSRRRREAAAARLSIERQRTFAAAQLIPGGDDRRSSSLGRRDGVRAETSEEQNSHSQRS